MRRNVLSVGAVACGLMLGWAAPAHAVGPAARAMGASVWPGNWPADSLTVPLGPTWPRPDPDETCRFAPGQRSA